jgi:plasmid maintenance system antidote protein VapI
MYKFKKDKYNEVISKYKIKGIAEKIGITSTYLSLILNNKNDCKKTVAYCITKAINSEAEIDDYFYLEN